MMKMHVLDRKLQHGVHYYDLQPMNENIYIVVLSSSATFSLLYLFGDKIPPTSFFLSILQHETSHSLLLILVPPSSNKGIELSSF